MTVMAPVKPAPWPRAVAKVSPGQRFPSIAVKMAASDGAYCFCATTGERSWTGVVSTCSREAALLDVFREVQADIGDGGPVHILLSFKPDSAVWRHMSELAAIGCLVERASFTDQPLMSAAAAGLTELIAQRCASAEAAATVGEELTVATDGSVRRSCSGYGWLASDGRYGLCGRNLPRMRMSPQAVLIAELAAVSAAVKSLPRQRLTVLSDSKAAVAVIGQWQAGQDTMGYLSSVSGPSPLVGMRDVIYAHRDRVCVRWIKGHCGDPLNEGADALARLASRYIRGDSGLSETDYAERAAGLARGFADEFTRRCA